MGYASLTHNLNFSKLPSTNRVTKIRFERRAVMAKCEIHGGICGQVTFVEAENAGNGKVSLKIISDCKHIKKVAEELVEIDAFSDLAKKAISNKTYEVVGKYSPHPACIVPSGILKAVEVAVDMALPGEASIKIEK